MLPFGEKLYEMFENIINNLYYCIQTISQREKSMRNYNNEYVIR